MFSNNNNSSSPSTIVANKKHKGQGDDFDGSSYSDNNAVDAAAAAIVRQKMLLLGQCVCNRPKAKVICKLCGYFVQKCRARRSCPTHPKVINLMDLGECPKCRAKWMDLEERAEDA